MASNYTAVTSVGPVPLTANLIDQIDELENFLVFDVEEDDLKPDGLARAVTRRMRAENSHHPDPARGDCADVGTGMEIFDSGNMAFEDGLRDDDLTAILMQEILRRLPDTVPYIQLKGAYWCSKMRSEEFGGFALHVTRDEIHWFDVESWLRDMGGY